MNEYAERCEEQRLAAQITDDILSLPEWDDINDDGDPHYIPRGEIQ